MQLLKEDISEEFVERMVDKVISRLTDKLEQLDISLDFIASLLANEDAAAISADQKTLGRTYKRSVDRGPNSG